MDLFTIEIQKVYAKKSLLCIIPINKSHAEKSPKWTMPVIGLTSRDLEASFQENVVR